MEIHREAACRPRQRYLPVLRHFRGTGDGLSDVAERTAPLPPAEVLIINSFHSGHFWEYNIIKRISEKLENTERASVYACIANISTMNAILPEVWITNS